MRSAFVRRRCMRVERQSVRVLAIYATRAWCQYLLVTAYGVYGAFLFWSWGEVWFTLLLLIFTPSVNAHPAITKY